MDDTAITASNHDRVPTPARLRSKHKSSPRSIHHGSSDYDYEDSNGNNFSSLHSIQLNNSTSSSLLGLGDNSPEGLHHRHPHRLDDHVNNSNQNSSPFKGHVISLPHHNHSKPSSIFSPFKKHKKSQWASLFLRFLFPILLLGCGMSLYLYANSSYQKVNLDIHEMGEKETWHQEERWREMRRSGSGGGNSREEGRDALTLGGQLDSISAKQESDYHEVKKRKSKRISSSLPFARRLISLDSHANVVRGPNFVTFGFNSVEQNRYNPHHQANDWSGLQREDVVETVKRRRIERRERTTGGLLHNQLINSDGVSYTNNNIDLDNIGVVKTTSGFLPLWYKLNHLTKDTMQSLHQRWTRQDQPDSTFLLEKDFPLCGLHAQTASEIYPRNYYPSSNSTTHFQPNHSPLGPNSRVLITGILSPLGMHLALALSRQCNVTNFVGIDTQMPNDPLSRLEHQERLSVLMEELVDMKSLQVPFLGVQSKQRRRKSPPNIVKAREDAFMNVFFHGELPEKYANLPKEYEIPTNMYGIPPLPGIHPDGFGFLETLLEYRPTHVVHLATTQSESFLTAKDVNTYVYPTQEEEEEVIFLKESISNKPYLYDLRMANAGMEQLLAGIVAQSILPPRYGRDESGGEKGDDSKKKISKEDLDKMRQPHFVYASSYDAGYFGELSRKINEKGQVDVSNNAVTIIEDTEDKDDLGSLSPSAQAPARGINGVSSLMNEVLASTYYALHGVSSVGLRFDAVYGPRGFGVPSTSIPLYNIHRIRRGGVSSDVDLAETAVRRLYRKWMKNVKKNEEENEDKVDEEALADEEADISLLEEAGWMHAAHDPRDFVFVNDAVGAIIAAMQYRAIGDSPATFNIGSGEMSTLSSIADDIDQLLSDDELDGNGKHALAKGVIDVELSSAARLASLDAKEYLQWSSTTTLQHGTANTLAWHLDRGLPFFPPSSDGSLPLDGEDILSRRGVKSCVQYRDPSCLRESIATPCSSECSTKTCMPSIFDRVIDLSREVTEDCEAVLYTASLGYDVKKLHLQTQYSDGQEQKNNNEPTLCTIAFVPSESRLVHNVIAKVPPSSLENMNLDLTDDTDYETKVKKLSGHLVHQGWLLIFVDGATEPLGAEDIFLPKLSPRRLFHPSVRRAMFVDENFSSTPMPDDALFLVSEMSRGKIKKRTVMGPNEKGKKIKYKLPEEPPRTAVMMLAPMRNLPKEDVHHMPLRELSKHMLKEAGANENNPEPKEVRVQREFYERARSLINSYDLRSLDDIAHHRIQMKDFIRSRWVLHDLKEEEGHQLRCEWYREHVRWNTHLDQLSFAYVMAKRELTRKVITEQPLQTEVEKKTLLQMVIDAKSDAKEWYPIFSGEGTTLPIHHTQMAPEAIPQNLQDQHDVTEVAPESTPEDDGSNTFYVRIMSDERMVGARKAWSKARQARLQQNKAVNIPPKDRQKIADAVQREKDRH